MNKLVCNTIASLTFCIGLFQNVFTKSDTAVKEDRKLVHVSEQQTIKISDIKNELEINAISFVDFVFTDLDGVLYEITLPVMSALSALDSGLKFDGSSIPGCSKIDSSDMHLEPDLNTFKILPLPHNGTKSARIMCHVCYSENVSNPEHPREILKQAVHKLRELGYQLHVGAELEFFLFKNVDGDIVPSDVSRYCHASANLQNWIDKKTLMMFLLEQGIDAEKIHHEVAQGQYEIVLRHANPLEMADQLVEAKHSIKMLAQQIGLKASFMPKPIAKENGSAMHVHFSLSDIKTGSNAFHSADDSSGLSLVAKQCIAGILSHVYEATALLNPTINSYKRLVPGYEAPVYVCWGNKNRSSLIRIPVINSNQVEAARAEIRSPDPSSNPYLVFAFLLYAAIDGIENKMELGVPASENLYRLSQERIADLGIVTLPESLQQAVDACSASSFMKNVFGDSFIQLFLRRQQTEIIHFQQAITDWELKYYL